MKHKYFLTRLLTVVMLSLLTMASASAQNRTFTFQTSAEHEGFSLEQSGKSSAHIRHALTSMSIETLDAESVSGEVISLSGLYLPNNAGAPNLPGDSRYLAIPQGATATLVVHSFQKQTIQNVDLLPAAPIQLENDNSPADYSKDMSIYGKDGLYPANPFQLSEPTTIRGLDVVIVGVTPFQYNPVTKELVVYYDIDMEVVFEGGNGHFGDDRLRSRWWDPIMQDMVLNREQLPLIDYNKKIQQAASNREEGCEYLIVVPDNEDFIRWADSIRLFRTHQGILTKIVTVSEIGGNTVAAMESYFNDAFNNWDIPPSAVLLLGDYNTDGSAGIVSHLLTDHPGGYNPYISDNPFADVTGNKLPDMVFARITANTEAQLEHMIHKSLNYERNPPVSPDFYNHPVTAMGWQTERWFQLCSEIVNGFWEFGLGKNPVRENAIYSGTPGGAWSSNANTSTIVSYFGPDGLNYIPATTAHLTDWGGNATRVNNDINAGAFMLQHRDHGMETGWGEPSYTNSSLNGLTNEDLTFVWSVNCLTGKFNYGSECFAEKFHRHEYGALGIIAATEVSYSFVNDTYVWGAFDNMWPEFMPLYGSNPVARGIIPSFANAAGKYFLQQSSWPYNPEHKNITYNLFHHHGDAFMNVYSEVPQELTVNHMPVLLSGLETFEVTANPGAFIALTNGDQIVGTAEAVEGTTQIPISFQEPGSQILITVTLQNFYRYEQLIDCIPPDGPYVIFNQQVAHDETGNNNGMVDFGESIELDLALKNVGNETAADVVATLTTESPFVTITNGSSTYGSIPSGEISMLENAFSFEVSDDVPDNTPLAFEVTMTSGDFTWTSSFAIQAYAPLFEIGNYAIDDSQGNNNGRLDPGETVTVTFSTMNEGHCASLDGNAILSIYSPLVTTINQEFTFESVGAGELIEASYEVLVNPAAPVGSMAEFNLLVTAGSYTAEKAFSAKVGLIVEDFETGDFTAFDWALGGNTPWVVTETGAYEGTYAAKSGAITHSQATNMQILYEAGSTDTLTFYYKVSSESGYDFLRFYVDGVKKGEWSGTAPWSRAAYLITEGTHLFKWEYTKDGSVSGGEDCGWIDFIAFPAMITTTGWAGNDLETCEENPVQVEGYADYYDSLEWSTMGDGSFDDITIINPIYTPGTSDIENGQVALHLTVTGEDVTIEDDVNVGIYRNPQLIVENAAAICAGDQFAFTTNEGQYYSTLEWNTSGDGSFDDATALMPVYTPGENDLTNGSVTLSVEAMAEGSCTNATASFDLTINSLPTASISGDQTICEGSEATIELTLTGASPWMVMMEDMVDPMMIETANYSMTMQPEAPMSMSLVSVSDGNGCQNTAEGTVTIEMDYAPEAPSMATGPNSLDLYDVQESSYTIEAVATAESYSWELLPAEAGEITATETAATVNWNGDYRGQATIKTMAANGCGESIWSEELVIELYSTIGLNELTAEQISVYPNPASNMLNIAFDQAQTGKRIISISNLLGETIVSQEVDLINQNRIQLPLSGLQNGAYLIHIASSDHSVMKPLLIKR